MGKNAFLKSPSTYDYYIISVNSDCIVVTIYLKGNKKLAPDIVEQKAIRLKSASQKWLKNPAGCTNNCVCIYVWLICVVQLLYCRGL